MDVSIINGDVRDVNKPYKAPVSRQALVNPFENASEGFLVDRCCASGAAGVWPQHSNRRTTSFTSRVIGIRPRKPKRPDRAYRIGQTKPVTVYYPMSLSAGFKTFDANLHLLLDRKAQLAKEALVPSPSVELKDFNGLDVTSLGRRMQLLRVFEGVEKVLKGTAKIVEPCDFFRFAIVHLQPHVQGGEREGTRLRS